MITDGTLSIKSLEWAYIVKKKTKHNMNVLRFLNFFYQLKRVFDTENSKTLE